MNCRISKGAGIVGSLAICRLEDVVNDEDLRTLGFHNCKATSIPTGSMQWLLLLLSGQTGFVVYKLPC